MAVLAGGLLACASPAALADSTLMTATIYGTQGTRQSSVSVASLQANAQQCPEYAGPGIEQHGRNSTFTPQLPAATWTLPTLLGCLDAPVSLGDVTAVTVVNLDGSPQTGPNSQLLAPDLASPSDFDNTAESPVISYRGSTIEYYRPWRGGNDRNAEDSVGQTSGSPIAIEVFEGPHLTVTATASDATPAVGSAVTFSATVSPSGNGLSYDWSFDGAAPDSTAAAPQTTFSKSGSYDVTVRVVDTTSGSAGTAAVPITVGTQSAPPPTTSTSTPPPTPPSNTTPAQTNTTPKSGGPRTSPHGKGPSGPNHHNGGPDKHHRNTGKTKPSSPNTNSTPTNQSPATQSGSAAASTAGTGASGTVGTHTTGHSHAPPAPHSSKPVRGPSSSPTTTSPQQPLVSGQLVSDVTLLPAAASPLVHLVPVSRTPSPAPTRAATASALTVAGSVITIVLLLSLGAARELRSRRDWLALRFSS